MAQRIPQHIPPYVTNSLMIRQEIQRFESVHPCIYALYDLIEEGLPADSPLQRQLHDYIVCIEDSFVNSQEWTLSRSVPDIKLGILGSVDSGKSALVHRYLTGSYLSDESPEGGRFKKEVIVDGQSHLLLLRDEGGMPEMQFSHWVDAVIFVFSLENETSFSSVYAHFARMAHYRDLSDLPMVLVGTQDTISESSPRVIDDARARKLAMDLKNCTYHETCATYGLNVERVFQDSFLSSRVYQNVPPPLSMRYNVVNSNESLHLQQLQQQQFHSSQFMQQQQQGPATTPTNSSTSSSPFNNQVQCFIITKYQQHTDLMLRDSKDFNDKNMLRRQQPPPPPQKKDLKSSSKLGPIPAAPVKQGFLYKRSTKPLRSEWKKKYVTLFDDGRLVFHSSIQDFTDNVHGKEIELMKTAVKVPGRCPRGSELSRPQISTNANMGTTILSKDVLTNEVSGQFFAHVNIYIFGNSAITFLADVEVPGTRPKGRPKKSWSHTIEQDMKALNLNEMDTTDHTTTGLEFLLHSLDNQQWHFKAQSSEDREDWVLAIEQQILFSLQQNISDKFNNRNSLSSTDSAVALAIRSTSGNYACADCGATNPDWASLNLGILICIECSGIHRNLGTHLSRVRSLDLDDWPSELVSVLTSIGNTAANSIFEANTQGRIKPSPSSPREEKERWIRAKYERKSFLPPLPYQDVPVTQQLMDTVARQDVLKCLLVLAYCTPDHVNTPYSKTDTRTALHIAAALANVVQVQLLLWAGANVFMMDHEHHYALFYAQSARSQDCVKLLVAQGCPDVISATSSPPV
ncbi:hypothetical protein HELRODRAFT_110061 [Helobdella robusta]|uniref:Small monomeric GTPase n=1 Tax=Helobdella robusta TaxID=6412 RepID=T1EEY9_HELRO|nr:hypothetical protein HELRODRAFT_110061 [Helobdella robusta]ESO08391.1 hypothetical protein HELRODRAFT_110061 [Helobdella robusta]